MSVTLEVSQKLISILVIFKLPAVIPPCNGPPLLLPDIFVTFVVQRFEFPFVSCVAKDELSTTVYKVPLMVAVSPTLALGHLQVPFSK